jgi:hypothetical protein
MATPSKNRFDMPGSRHKWVATSPAMIKRKGYRFMKTFLRSWRTSLLYFAVCCLTLRLAISNELEMEVGDTEEIYLEATCPVDRFTTPDPNILEVEWKRDQGSAGNGYSLKLTLQGDPETPDLGPVEVLAHSGENETVALFVIPPLPPPDLLHPSSLTVRSSGNSYFLAQIPNLQYHAEFKPVQDDFVGSGPHKGRGICLTLILSGEAPVGKAGALAGEAAKQASFRFPVDLANVSFVQGQSIVNEATLCQSAQGVAFEKTVLGRLMQRMMRRLGKNVVPNSAFPSGVISQGATVTMLVEPIRKSLTEIQGYTPEDFNTELLLWPAYGNYPVERRLINAEGVSVPPGQNPASRYVEMGSMRAENVGSTIQLVSGSPGQWLVITTPSPIVGRAMRNLRAIGNVMTWAEFSNLAVASHPDRVSKSTGSIGVTVDAIFAKYCIAYDPTPATNPDGPLAGRLSMMVSPVLTHLTANSFFHAQLMEVQRLRGYLPICTGWISRTADGQVMIDTESAGGVLGWALRHGFTEATLTERLTAALTDFIAQEGITNNPMLFLPNLP